MKFLLAACLLGAAVASPLPVEPVDGLLPVVSEIKGILSTDYGFQQVKSYLSNLRSEDSVATNIKLVFRHYSDEEWKDVINAFFAKIPILAIEPGFDYPTLTQLFGEVKAVLATDEGVAVVREYMENLDTPNEILQAILDLLLLKDNGDLKHFFSVLFSEVPDYQFAQYSIRDDLESTVAQLKAIVVTPEGLKKAKDTINNIQSTHPTLILVKTVLSSMSDASLISLVKEAGKNIPDVAIPSPEPNLLDLVGKAKDLLITDEGLGFLRNYFNNLQTGNFLIVRVKMVVNSRTDAQLKEAIVGGWKEIFGGEYVALYGAEEMSFLTAFAFIKQQVRYPKGFNELTTYLTNLKPRNIYVQLGKAFFLQLSDEVRRDFLHEALKNVPLIAVEPGFQYPGLAELFGRVKDIILNEDGLQQLREYATELESDNLLVQRVRAELITADDDILTGVLVDLFQGV